MIVLGIDPAYSKPIHVAKFVDGVFNGIQCVPYPYAEQPVMFFDQFKLIFREALANAECPECGWTGQKKELYYDGEQSPCCPRCKCDYCKVKEGGALVAIEKPVFIKVNFQSFIKIHEVYVALKVIALYEGIGVVTFAPSSWRKAHGFTQGKGVKSQNLKTQAVEKVEGLLGERFFGPFSEQADQAESYLIALAAMKPKHKMVTIGENRR